MLLTLYTATNTPLAPTRTGVPGVQREREGTAHARCDAEGMRTVMHRDMDGLVVEQGIVRLRHRQHARKSAFASVVRVEVGV